MTAAPSSRPSSAVHWNRAVWPVVFAGMIFLASEQSQVAGPKGIPHFDKIVHTGVFGLLATLVIRIFFSSTMPVRSALLTVAIVSAYGALDEFHQSFTPGRSVEFGDWVADTVGAALAASAYAFVPAWRSLLEVRPVARGGRRTKGEPRAAKTDAGSTAEARR